MESIISAAITAIATLFAVWLNSFLTKKKKMRSLSNVESLIKEKKVKKITIFLQEESEDFDSISEASENKTLIISDESIIMKADFFKEKDLNIENMNILKTFNETIRGKMKWL